MKPRRRNDFRERQRLRALDREAAEMAADVEYWSHELRTESLRYHAAGEDLAVVPDCIDALRARLRELYAVPRWALQERRRLP